MKFLLELYEGKVVAPKASQISYCNVLFPPTQGELVAIITEMIDSNQGYKSEAIKLQWKRLGFHIKKNRPPKAWLVGLLYFFDSHHVVFSKGYRPDKAVQRDELVAPLIENKNGFFDDLPALGVKELKRQGGVSFLSKRQRLEYDMQRLEQRQQKLELAKLRKQEALENIDDDDGLDMKVKVSMKDYDLLQRAKQQEA
jgi:hypothetical protein